MTPASMPVQSKPGVAAAAGQPDGKRAAGQPFMLDSGAAPAASAGEVPVSEGSNDPSVDTATNDQDQSGAASRQSEAEAGNDAVPLHACCSPPVPSLPASVTAAGEPAEDGDLATGNATAEPGKGGPVHAGARLVPDVIANALQLPGNKAATHTGKLLLADAKVLRPAPEAGQQPRPARQGDEMLHVARGNTNVQLEWTDEASGNGPELTFRARLSLHAFNAGSGARSVVATNATGTSELVPDALTGAVSIAGQVANAIVSEPVSDEAAAVGVSAAAMPDSAEMPATLVRQLNIRLNPDHLGEVRITMALDADGTMLVTLTAAEERTGDLFRQSTGDLVKLLQGQGVDVKSVTVLQPDAGQVSGSTARQAGAEPDGHQGAPMSNDQGHGASSGDDREMANRRGAGDAMRKDQNGNGPILPGTASGESGVVFV
jgi:hypothetical protein